MAVVKNMMVRVGADMSSLISQCQSSSQAVKSWSTSTTQAFQKVQSGTNGSAASINNAFGGMAAKATQTGAVIKSALRGAFAIAGITSAVGLLRDAVGAASDLAEVQNVVDTAFGDMASGVDVWAKNAITQYGLSELAAKRMSSTYMSMASALGVSSGAAADMSLSLTGLAADVASFYNLSADEAAGKLNAVFTGETESLKSLGVVMNQNNLQAWATANGYDTLYSKMSSAQQVAVRYGYVMEALNLAQGDFAKTSDSWANQTKILKTQWEQFLAILGEGLIAVATPFLQSLNSMVSGLVGFGNAVSEVFSTLFGGTKTIFGTGTGGGSTGLNSFNNGMLDAAANTDLLKQASDAAADSVDTLKRSMMGFDKINKLSDTGSGGGSGGGGGGGGTGGGGGGGVPGVTTNTVETASTILSGLSDVASGVSDAFSGLKEWLLGLNWQPLKDAWDGLSSSVGVLADKISDGLKWAYDNVLKPVGEWTVEEGLPEVLETVGAAIDTISIAAEALKPWWDWLYENVLAPATARLGQNVIDSLNGVQAALEGIGNYIKGDYKAAWDDFVKAYDYITGGEDKVTKRIEVNGDYEEKYNGLKDAGKVSAFHSWWHDVRNDPLNIVSRTIELGAELKDNFSEGWNTITGCFTDVTDAEGNPKGILKGVIDALTTVQDTFGGLFTAAKDAFSGVVETVKTFGGNIRDSITAIQEWLGGIKFNGFEALLNGEDLFTLPDSQELTIKLNSIWTDKEALTEYENTKDGTASKSLSATLADAGKAAIDLFSSLLPGSVKKSLFATLEKGGSAIDKYNGAKTTSVTKTMAATLKSGGTAIDKYNGPKTATVTKTLTATMSEDSKKKADTYDNLKNGSANKTLTFNSSKPSSVYTPKVSWTSLANLLNPKVDWVSTKVMARGGVVDRATNAIIGEAGREAVVPLEYNTEWANIVADKMAQRLAVIGGHSGGSNQPLVVQVMLDGRVVAENTVSQLQQMGRQGRYPLSGLV